MRDDRTVAFFGGGEGTGFADRGLKRRNLRSCLFDLGDSFRRVILQPVAHRDMRRIFFAVWPDVILRHGRDCLRVLLAKFALGIDVYLSRSEVVDGLYFLFCSLICGRILGSLRLFLNLLHNRFLGCWLALWRFGFWLCFDLGWSGSRLRSRRWR